MAPLPAVGAFVFTWFIDLLLVGAIVIGGFAAVAYLGNKLERGSRTRPACVDASACADDAPRSEQP